MRLSIFSTVTQQLVYQKLGKIFLTQIIFLFLISFITLNYLLDFFHEVFFLNYSAILNYSVFFPTGYKKLFNMSAISFNLIDVYVYPFLYVFLLITCLSLVFCLTYNKDELVSFMFYCQVILFAGYLLFFTESLIIFFFSYEMLLIPSFFILYKFAKTRRCIEAAYLMFF